MEPDALLWGPVIASFSMYPLLVRDGAGMAYLALQTLYVVVISGLMPKGSTNSSSSRTLQRLKRTVVLLSVTVGVILHTVRCLPPPERYPWLHDRAFISFSFIFFAAEMLYLNWKQWHLAGGPTDQTRVKQA